MRFTIPTIPADTRTSLPTLTEGRMPLWTLSRDRISLVTTLGNGGVVIPPPSILVYPVSSGIVRIGETLTSTSGSWSNAVSFAYQWFRTSGPGSVAILGATSSSYVVTALDMSEGVFCQVIATGPGGVSSPEYSNVLESPWRDILVAKPNILIFDGLDPVCMGGASISSSVAAMSTVNGISLGSQATGGNQAIRDATGLTFNGTNNYYVFTSLVASYFDNLTTYAIHAEGISGATTRYFYSVASTSSPTIVRNARVAASASTSRNDHRTNATLLTGPATASQDIVLRWEPSNSAIFDLTSGVVAFATTARTPSTASFDQMNLGSNTSLGGYWTGTLSAWAVDSSAWTTGDMAIWRSCAIAAGVM